MTGVPGRLPWWAAVLVAAAGGYLLDVASPGIAWWPASFLGAALVFAAVWQRSWRTGLLTGAVAGAAFWLPHVSWLTLYLGPIPWLGLCGLMILWFALFGVAVAVMSTGLAQTPVLAARPWLLLAAQSLAAAGLWVLREQVQGAWPYGGYPWGRLAHMQSGAPFADLVSWLGFAGLSGLIALICAVPVAAAGALRGGVRDRGRSRTPTRTRSLVVGGLVGVAAVIGLAFVPPALLQTTGELRVAAVQGNSKSGIFDDRESGDVLDDHVEATEHLLDRLEADGETVDVIVWPENSAEFDLPNNPLAKQRIAKLSQRAGAPIVLGTILVNDDGSYTNSSLVWGPEGAEPSAENPTRYDKRYPVPFAEYMPNREFFHLLVPDLVDLVQLEYSPGELPAVVEVETPVGPVRAGLAICFDIIFDTQAVAMVDDGAEVIFAQTNNADFGRTDESAQQLAIARLRALETGRALVNISTVGTSAVIGQGGEELAALEPHTADAMVATVPLVTGQTPAMILGSTVAAIWGLLGIAGLAVGCATLLKRRTAAKSDGPDASADRTVSRDAA
ncbi:MAG: apolipoprotein N-acyltransferase [Leucobacter sp.]